MTYEEIARAGPSELNELLAREVFGTFDAGRGQAPDYCHKKERFFDLAAYLDEHADYWRVGRKLAGQANPYYCAVQMPGGNLYVGFQGPFFQLAAARTVLMIHHRAYPVGTFTQVVAEANAVPRRTL